MAVFDDSPSQAHQFVSRAKSFHGLPAGYDGDTQPMPSQVYRDYTKSTLHMGTREEKHVAESLAAFTQYTTQQDGSLVQGETGHVDLMQHWNASEGPTYHEISSDEESDDDVGGHGETQDLLSSVNRPAFPKTPATAAQKRNHRGEPISAASTKTPASATSAFGAFGVFGTFGNGAAMSTTQMFHATQAASSPLPDSMPSDHVFTRPSPNLHNLSSPLLNLESPITPAHALQSRATTEPRDNYMSMKASQDKRKHKATVPFESAFSDHSTRSPGHTRVDDADDADEDDEDSAQLRQARKRQHAMLSNQAMLSWEGVKAPGRPVSRTTAVSPVYGVHVPRVTFRRSSSRDRENRDRREVVELLEHPSPDVDLADEYDELAQDVRPSQRDLHSDESSQDGHAGQDDLQLQGDPSSPPYLHSASLPHDARHPSVDPDEAAFAVADSQPEHQGPKQPTLPIAPSSMSSIVPGSQFPSTYGQSTENERATDGVARLPVIPDKPLRTSQQASSHVPQRLPSSPPALSAPSVVSDMLNREPDARPVQADLSNSSAPVSSPAIASKVQGDSSLAPLPHKSSQRPLPRSAHNTQTSAVPETDPLEVEDELPANISYSHNAGEFAPSNPSEKAQHNTTSTVFETAPSHQKSSASQKHLASQRPSSQLVPQSPREAAGILRFADITNDSTPIDALQDLDVDIEVLNEEDRDYIKAMESSASEPVKKRLRMYGKRANRANALSSRSNAANGVPAQAVQPPMRPQTSPSTRGSPASPDRPHGDYETLKDGGSTQTHAESGSGRTPEARSTMPSPTKPCQVVQANAKQTTPLSSGAPIETVSPTPPSVRRREEAGALAASKSLSNRHPRKGEVVKSARGKLVRPKDRTNPRSLHQTPRAQSRLAAPEIAETPQSMSVAVPVASVSVESRDADTNDAPGNIAENQAISDEPPPRTENVPPTSVANSVDGRQSCPGRVFALFKGTGQAYYPATCLGAATIDGQKLHVRFDDDTTTQLESWLVCRLELRRGDQVKVDLPGLRNKVYIVTGLKNKPEESTEDQRSTTDIHGHTAVHLIIKDRDSLSGAPSASAAANLTVPIASLYLTHTMFVKFEERKVEIRHTTRSQSRNQTPVTEFAAPTTPGSRSRRSMLPAGASVLRLDVDSPLPPVKGVFAGMAFAVSYSSKQEAEKDRLLNMIQRNGGLVIEQGFDELFNTMELPETAEAPTPSMSRHDNQPPSPTDERPTYGVESLTLSARAKSLGFVALIADAHSRRAKYIQALALSLPCLSGRWVTDSVAKGSPAPWPRYLLPAGQSVYLFDTIRSRTLAPYDVADAKLVDTFRDRDRLLQGGRVLLVGQSGKAKWEARKAYAFLTIALGATEVRRVVGLDAAKRILSQEGESWNWVYVEGTIEDAEKALFDGGNVDRSTVKARKRKRGGGASLQTNNKMMTSNGKFRIVGDEFVVQSLILGSLLEEE